MWSSVTRVTNIFYIKRIRDQNWVSCGLNASRSIMIAIHLISSAVWRACFGPTERHLCRFSPSDLYVNARHITEQPMWSNDTFVAVTWILGTWCRPRSFCRLFSYAMMHAAATACRICVRPRGFRCWQLISRR